MELKESVKIKQYLRNKELPEWLIEKMILRIRDAFINEDGTMTFRLSVTDRSLWKAETAPSA